MTRTIPQPRRGLSVPAALRNGFQTREEMAEAKQAWLRDNARFNFVARSHLWEINGFETLAVPVMGHDTAIVEVRIDCPHGPDQSDPCSCVRGDMTKAVCFTCTWQSPVRGEVWVDRMWGLTPLNLVHLLHDHAAPGWRELPIITPVRGDASPEVQRRWTEEVADLYPAEFQRTGAPVITDRRPPVNRSVPGRSPWGGYDIAATPTVGWSGGLF
ncbi:hypothetical protein D1871_04505 [Nakamurella silvestris]|nr:hypothetical protein D1871_04505 [Nakamurella silvestris]